MSNNGTENKKSKKKSYRQINGKAWARRWQKKKERPEVGLGSWAQFSSNFSLFDVCFSFARTCARNGMGFAHQTIWFRNVAYLAIILLLSLCLRINFCSFAHFGVFCLLSLYSLHSLLSFCFVWFVCLCARAFSFPTFCRLLFNSLNHSK